MNEQPAVLDKTWEQVRRELFSPQEIAASDQRVELMRILARARKTLGLSQARLGELTGVERSVISRIERGETSPKLDTLIKLLTALNVKLQLVPLNQISPSTKNF